MTHVLRIAHLRIALHVANPEVGKREGIHGPQSPNETMEVQIKHNK